MTLDPKGIEAALYEMIDKGDFYYAPDVEDVETAILAYLQATDSVVVPREVVGLIKSHWAGSYFEGVSATDAARMNTAFRAMIQAAEGK